MEHTHEISHVIGYFPLNEPAFKIKIVLDKFQEVSENFLAIRLENLVYQRGSSLFLEDPLGLRFYD